MNASKISKSDFSFIWSGYGRYDVIYTSPVTGKRWKCTLQSITIDDVKYEDEPKVKDLKTLKFICKQGVALGVS
jgi:hypothetical protein